ncbi:hypothetical protein GYMLUDRAFT_904941 [Collybiopsis luxurians FD-317 M1]|uniref:Uncharacterized protein n=1 Tax=Collybiopsis luxurians FD-317 M1 TaxID=944289 RepID=A0A0D0CHP0_9AGAR|nr:hypothetical protein GYMLUDRAFT_904941 [Collybiopsis luxurians FD-317 M1]
MNAEDLTIIVRTGDIVRSIAFGYIIISILFGLYIGTSGFAIYFMTRNGLRRRPRQIVLFIQLCLCTMSTINFVTICAEGFLEPQMILIHGHSLELEERVLAYRASKAPLLLYYIGNISGSLNVRYQHTHVHTNHDNIAHIFCFQQFLFSDTLVFWRAWAIWHGHRFLQFILIAFAISNAALIVLSTAIGPFKSDLSESVGSAFKSSLSLFFSLISNILATSAIAYKAWKMNIFGKEHHSQLGRTRTYKILRFLVESGTLFCLLQVVYYAMVIAADMNAKSATTFSLSYNSILRYVAVMILPFYPTVLLIVLHLIWESDSE